MDENYKPGSPYVGLVPYTDRDAEFFFGRETETEIISANLRSARLTVLYGTSGVGKSSVLQAGVVHSLRELAKEDVKTYGQAEFAVAIYRDWASDPIRGIADAVRQAVAESLQIEPEILEPIPETKDFVKILRAWSQRYSLELLIILDQFEEFLNYLRDKNPFAQNFAEQFAEAVKDQDLSVRFLLSLRDDTLSLLDCFKETIPGLLDNRLQLGRLTAQNARSAITKPIASYNKVCTTDTEYSIEPQLVDEVVEQIKFKSKKVDEEGVGEADSSQPENAGIAKAGDEDPDQIYVETPNLQLVMKRIWFEEIGVGSNTLRIDTLKKLGGVEKIIQTHLDEVMNTLSSEEKRIVSDCFEYLATPMETKVALTAKALAQWTDYEEEKIAEVMEILIKGKKPKSEGLDITLPINDQKVPIASEPASESRILRAVEISAGKKKLRGYEVTHDAYVPAILDWRRRYEIEHSVTTKLKTARKIGSFVLLGLLVLTVISVYRGYVNSYRTTELEDTLVAKTEEYTANQQKLVNQNEVLEERVSLSETAELNAKKEKAGDKTAAYDELIPVLINLSSPSVKEKDSAYENLKNLIEEKKVPEEYEKSIIEMTAKIDKQKADDLRKAALETKRIKLIKPQVYIHITDSNEMATARSYKNFFESNGFIVPEIQIVETIKGKLRSPQIRYFRREDSSLADDLARLLTSKGITNARAYYIEGYEDSSVVRPKQLELWFSDNTVTYAK